MNLLEKFHAEAAAAFQKGECIVCKQKFSAQNVFTEAGARETKISGTCEKCFDEMFADEDE